MIAKMEPNKEGTHMKIGFIGAGLIGGRLARLAMISASDKGGFRAARRPGPKPRLERRQTRPASSASIVGVGVDALRPEGLKA